MEKIYQVFMGRFNKDFRDLTYKLHYIKFLGFDSVLLTPFFDSNSYHNYDCKDFFKIKEEYGTIDDFKAFIKELEGLDMDCYIDFPVCHTSNEHQLFKESKQGLNDCYVWSDRLPEKEYWYPTPMTDCSWHQCGMTGKWYLGVWGNRLMPSLNIHSDRVKEELTNMFKYWLGFSERIHCRLDAILYIDPIYATALDQCYWIKDVIEGIKPGTKVIGEIWDNDDKIVENFSKALGSCFSFTDAAEIKSSACNNREYKQIGGSDLTYFCSNHDQTRLMDSVGYDVDRLKKCFDMLYSTNGKAITVYYGDEIGMTGIANGLDHEDVRKPMDWNEVDRQMSDKNSILNHIRNLNLRR